MRRVRRFPVAVGTALVVLAASACTDSGGSGTAASPTPSRIAAPAAAPATCKDGQPKEASVSASSSATGTTISGIRERGRLVVGTSADAPLWGATVVGDQNGSLDGFDVRLAGRLAAGLSQALGKKIGVEYRVLPLADRQPALNRPVSEGGVDLVAERMTITCARWQGTDTAPAVNFSTTYYTAGQNRLLVRSSDSRSGIRNFKGSPVCGVTGSSSLAAVQGAGAEIVEAPSAGQCLVKFLQGEAEAVVGDDTTLAGLVTLAAGTEVVGSGAPDVPYGLGTPPGDDAFTAWVNGQLEDYRGNGTLRSLATAAEADNPLPAPQYGRQVDRLGRSG
jgi:ABC-type amino acid transport substrate-binding protein